MISQRFLFLLTISFLFFSSVVGGENLKTEIHNLETFGELYHIVESQYFKEISGKTLIRGAIKGMFKVLDPHSQVLSARQLETLENRAAGRYSGIGIVTVPENETLRIVKVYKNSPARKAGLLVNDLIEKIGGKVVKNTTPEDLNLAAWGKPGSKVSLTYRREPDKTPKTATLSRKRFQTDSVEEYLPEEGILVLKIDNFQKSTPQETRERLLLHQPETIIVDLRNNPGGLLLSAVETAEMFTGPGPIVSLQNRGNSPLKTYRALKKSLLPNLKILILLNKHSASAAEIFAAAVKENGKGKIVGEKSWGKGTVQKFERVSEDVGIKLTTAEYLTPSGLNIHGKGIHPDYAVADDIQYQDFGPKDAVFQKALELAKSAF